MMNNWHQGFNEIQQIAIYFCTVVLSMLFSFFFGSLIIKRLRKVALLKKEEGKSFVFEIYVGLFFVSSYLPLFLPSILWAYSPFKEYLPNIEFFAGLILFWQIILWTIVFFWIKGKEITQLYKVAHRDMSRNPFKR